MSSMITAIVVAELPALRAVDGSAPPLDAASAGGSTTPALPAAPPPQPKFVLILPHSDPSRLPKNVLSFCFPDLDHLARSPFCYEHTAEEYTFTLTPKDEPRVHGYCRRYRVGAPWLGSRLDLSPYCASDVKSAAATPLFQCICILSERPYHRLFSQCLQLLHAARLAGGPVAMRLARQLLSFENPVPGQLLSLRGLVTASQVPGSLHLPRERLRVPPFFGLPYSDVPLTPLLMRLDAPALMMLYVAMLCERRIIFVSQSIATLTSCVHAAAALLQPFEWQNIFIPVLSSSYLPYCCAPNPYLLGLTPAQFSQLCDEYGVGEVVLVALDEGYVAALNNSMPLIDLEGATAANSSTGEMSYAGPKLSVERAASRVGAIAGGFGGLDSPSAGLGAARAAVARATELGVPSPAAGSGGQALGSPGTTMLPAAAAGGPEVAFSPFHSISRSHAYDDEVVVARMQRRAYAGRRLAAKRVARDRVAVIYSREVGGDAAANRARRAQSHQADPWGTSDAADVAFGGGAAPVARDPSTGASTALATAAAWGGAADPAEAWAADGSGRPAAGAPNQAPLPLSATVSPSGAAEIQAARRRSGVGAAPGAPAPRPSLTPIVTAAAVVSASASDAALEVDGNIADQLGVAQLPVDLSSLTTRGDPAVGKRRAHKRPPSVVALPEIGGLGGGGGGYNREMSMYKRAIANAGKVLALATGTPASDCPCARLAFELRAIYTRERREGAFDEAGLYAALLAFVAVVFGRAADFVHVEGEQPHGSSRGSSGGHPIFAKEEFVRFTVRHQTVARLLEEVQHSQLLQALAGDTYTRSRASAFLAGDPAHVAAARAAPPHVIELAFSEATASAAAGAGNSTHGSGSQRSVGSGATTPVMGGSIGATMGGPAALLGPLPSFSTIMKRVGVVLAAQFDPFFDLQPNALGMDRGIAGSTLTAVKALESLTHAAACVTAVAFIAPEPGPATVVTALRALLAAATATAAHPEEPPSVIARIALAASHDPVLCPVVLGVIWARLNDCTDRNWQHGYKALMLLLTLLRTGSPRVMSQAASFVPLLRFLIHPTRALAAHAASAAEDMNGQASSASWVSAANVLRCSRSRGGVGLFTAVPGVLLSTAPQPLAAIGPAEGAGMIAKAAGRVYAILVAPRRWLVERALAIGPAALMHGSPLTMPLPFSLTLPVCVTAVAAAGSTAGWLPTAQQPSHPSSGGWHSDYGYDEGRGSHAAVISVGKECIKKQPQAAAVDWPTVHRVAVPCMASSSSAALHALAVEYGQDPDRIIARPTPDSSPLPADSKAATPGGAEAQIAHKRPHSLAACFAMPHDTSFGSVMTAQAKLAQRSAPRPAGASEWLPVVSFDSAPPPRSRAAASIPAASALPTKPAPAGSFEVFGDASAAASSIPRNVPAPDDDANFPAHAPPVSFGTPAGKSAAASGGGKASQLAVPSSEFEFGSPPPARASSSSAPPPPPPAPAAPSSSPFDSWATNDSATSAGAAASRSGPNNSSGANSGSSAASSVAATRVSAAAGDVFSLAAPAMTAAPPAATAGSSTPFFPGIPLSQGILGAQGVAARAAAISSLGDSGPPVPMHFQLPASRPPFTPPLGAGGGVSPAVFPPLPAPTAPATVAAASDPFGFNSSPPAAAALPPGGAARSGAGWEARHPATPNLFPVSTFSSPAVPVDPFGFPDVAEAGAVQPTTPAAVDPFAF